MYKIKQIDHTADTGFSIEADKREDLITGSIKALDGLLGILKLPKDIKGNTGKHHIRVEGSDAVDMMIEALNEYLYFVQVNVLIAKNIKVAWNKNKLLLDVEGIFSWPKIPLETEIKAVTYHKASITPPNSDNDMWKATWIADL